MLKKLLSPPSVKALHDAELARYSRLLRNAEIELMQAKSHLEDIEAIRDLYKKRVERITNDSL